MVCINKPLPDISLGIPYSNRCSDRISSLKLMTLEDLCTDNLKILFQDTIPLKSNSNRQGYKELFTDYIVGA